jgi:replicative DNA helicase
MSTQPAPRRLAVVSSPTSTEPDRRAETVVRQWDPEAQLVGALMHLHRDEAAAIVALVPDTAIWAPDNRWAFEIIRYLVDDGQSPDPVLVLGTAQQRPPADDLAGGSRQAISATRLHRFAVHLADLYTQTITPAAAHRYAREVLEQAYRRAVGAHGARMAQLAETAVTREQLTHCLTAMRAELADLWRRAEAAAR